MTDKRVEAAARAICRSGRFETGQGTCAVLCMSQLGDARKRPCEYATRLHGKMAQASLAAADAAVADEAKRGRDAMRQWAADMEAAAFSKRDAKLAALSIDLLKCAVLIERMAGLKDDDAGRAALKENPDADKI